MDYQKINFDEMGWFCRSTRAPIQVNCLPGRLHIIDCFMSILRIYGIYSFSAREMACLFRLVELLKPRADGLICPAVSQIEQSLGKRFMNNQISLSNGIYTTAPTAEDSYRDWYPKAVKEAEENGNIRDWVEYAIEYNFICNATLSKKLLKAQQSLRG